MQYMTLDILDWFKGLVEALFSFIPKFAYLIYASVACILDFFQLMFRKLAGLDVYYMTNPSTGATEAVTGDLVTNFITGILGINSNGFTYSALSTVFWAMVLFGVIVTFGTTIIAMLKSHYSYDAKSGGPIQILYQGGKALLNIVAVPIIVVLGLFVMQALLRALDDITSTTNGTVISQFGTYEDVELQDGEQVPVDRSIASRYFESTRTRRSTDTEEERTYIYYDMFGIQSDIVYGKSLIANISTQTEEGRALIAATNQTFSGMLFKSAAYSANRVRLGHFSIVNTEDNRDIFTGGPHDESLPIFQNAKTDEELADMIDTLFACNIHLKLNDWSAGISGSGYVLDYSGGMAPYISLDFFTNFLTRSFTTFSKFNIGLVWYYYDLWAFNFVVGFGAVIICVVLFINIILGLMTRFFMALGLFLIAPTAFGLEPLDKGTAKKFWIETFVKQLFMVFGAVVGMNLFFLIMPYINRIKFFNIMLADYLVQTLFVIVGLITVKSFIAAVSAMIKGEDAQAVGDKSGKEVGKTLGKGASMAFGAATLPLKGIRAGLQLEKMEQLKAASAAAKSAATTAQADVNTYEGRTTNLQDYQNKVELFNRAADKNGGIRKGLNLDRSQFMAEAERLGINSSEAADMFTAAQRNLRVDKGTANAQTFAAKYVNDYKSSSAAAAAFDSNNATYHMLNSVTDTNNFNTALASARSRRDSAKAILKTNMEAYQQNEIDLKRERKLYDKRNDLGTIFRSPLTYMHDTVRSHEGVVEFEHETGIKKKPDWARDTATNTASTNASLASLQESIDRLNENLRNR